MLPQTAVAAMRAALHDVAGQTIAAVAAEVPGYADIDAGAQATLAESVELALTGFLALAGERRDPSAPLAPATAGAYALGRGEARGGRSLDALLAAYRVGARVAWRGLAGAALDTLAPEDLVAFAELVFAYIDRLSAASVAGHADELASADRARAHHLARLAHGLVAGAAEPELVAAAERARWSPPSQLAAVLVVEAEVDSVLARLDRRTLQAEPDAPDLPEGAAALLVGDAGTRLDVALRRAGHAVVGPARPWPQVSASYRRAVQVWHLPHPRQRVHADDLLAELVVSADPDAMADLRARALAPLSGLRPAAAARLAETLRAWLLHRGRRDEVAAALFVHPQTVRYRMGQVRELFADQLDDPRGVLELTIALARPDGTGWQPAVGQRL